MNNKTLFGLYRIHFIHVLYLSIFILLTSCSKTPQESNTQNEVTTSLYSVYIFTNPDQSYGYDILRSNKVFIHQPIIPAIQGSRGFASQSDARRTAEIMVQKLEFGKNPPSITRMELDSIGIVLN